MSLYKSLFTKLEEANEGAFVPFTLVGYPNGEDFLKTIDTMVEAGSDALELGLPFSDPVADGPVIQAASVHTLDQGLVRADYFKLLKAVSVKYPTIPIGLLVYGNLVVGQGMDRFYAEAKEAGVSSVLIADVPSRETAPFRAAAKAQGIETVLIAPPNASEETLERVASEGAGYTYVLGRAGITGTHQAAKIPEQAFIKTLEANKAPALVAGFGFSEPEGVKAAITAGLKGVICGSAIVKLIPTTGVNDQVQEELFNFCKAMKSATLSDQKVSDGKGKTEAA